MSSVGPGTGPGPEDVGMKGVGVLDRVVKYRLSEKEATEQKLEQGEGGSYASFWGTTREYSRLREQPGQRPWGRNALGGIARAQEKPEPVEQKEER